MGDKVPIVHVLYPRRWDVEDWTEKHAQGLEPDRYQYGFDRMEKYCFKVTYCRFPHGKLLQKLAGLCTRLFKFTFDPFYFAFQLQHLLAADIIINPLDHEGFTLCWLRKHNLFGLRRKKHIFVAVWLPSYVQTCSQRQLKRFKALLSTVDICMYYCEHAKNILKEYLDIPDEKLEKMHFGVDADFYTEVEVAEENFILAPGNDSFRDFEILSEVAKALPHETFCLASNIKIKNQIPSNMHYLKLKYNSELLDYYRRAKAILIPIKKDCPTSCGSSVLMEAMLLKKPVIVTATNYMKEAIGDRETAVMVAPGSAEAIVKATQLLHGNPALRKKIGTTARAEALKCFTSENCMQKMADSINTLLLAEKSRKKTIHILYPANWSVDRWSKDYEKGLVPDRYQYGFNRLEKYGFNVTYAHFPQSLIMQKFANLTKRIFRYTFNPYYFIFQRKHLRKADVFISPLDPEGLMFCWLRKHKILDLHKKKHIYIPAWLPAWAQNASNRELKILRSLIATVDVLMYFGESDKKIYKELLLLPDEKLEKVNWGVDIDFFKPHPTEEKNFIFAPGNDVFRDFETLEEVAAELPHEQFIIASPRKLVLNIHPPNLTIKSVSHRDVVDLYSQAKAVVIPLQKDCPTSSGVTVLKEALLFNKRIIVSSSDLMKELTSGWESHVILVEPESKKSLKKAIQNHVYPEPRLKLNEEQKATLCTEHYMQKLSEIINH